MNYEQPSPYIGSSPSGFSPIVGSNFADLPPIPMDQGFFSSFSSFPGTDLLADDFDSDKYYGFGGDSTMTEEGPPKLAIDLLNEDFGKDTPETTPPAESSAAEKSPKPSPDENRPPTI